MFFRVCSSSTLGVSCDACHRRCTMNSIMIRVRVASWETHCLHYDQSLMMMIVTMTMALTMTVTMTMAMTMTMALTMTTTTTTTLPIANHSGAHRQWVPLISLGLRSASRFSQSSSSSSSSSWFSLARFVCIVRCPQQRLCAQVHLDTALGCGVGEL